MSGAYEYAFTSASALSSGSDAAVIVCGAPGTLAVAGEEATTGTAVTAVCPAAPAGASLFAAVLDFTSNDPASAAGSFTTS